MHDIDLRTLVVFHLHLHPPSCMHGEEAAAPFPFVKVHLRNAQSPFGVYWMNMGCCVVKEEQELIQWNNPRGRYICHWFEDKILISELNLKVSCWSTRCSKTESLASQDQSLRLFHSSTYAISIFSVPSVSTWQATKLLGPFILLHCLVSIACQGL
jgi:hypothetical protein